MVKFLLDTNALAEPIRPRPNAAFMKKLRANESKLGVASVTLHEALYGVERLPDGKRKQDLRDFVRDVLSKLTVFSYDEAVAAWHAHERVRLETIGRTVPYADGQIAATAVVHDLTLVTANVKDFRGIRGLKVENWRS